MRFAVAVIKHRKIGEKKVLFQRTTHSPSLQEVRVGALGGPEAEAVEERFLLAFPAGFTHLVCFLLSPRALRCDVAPPTLGVAYACSSLLKKITP